MKKKRARENRNTATPEIESMVLISAFC